jgi:UDP-N-acetylglucosamine/UDP-N-acetylgalactosamine diphosphorylase
MIAPELISRFQRAGQGQVFAFFDRLPPDGQQRLLAEAAEIDLEEIGRLHHTLVAKKADSAVNLTGLQPAPYEALPQDGGDGLRWVQAKAAGEAALRSGRVAAFTVAGGQGTRLGFDGPKGTFPITPVRRKPLFQVFAEKIRAAERRYGRPLHWFIMTSHQNHEATVAFFGEHRHFGLDAGRVHFFRQGRMPAIGFDGKILLQAPDAIALSPDGHGGSLRALDRSGALDLMAREGVQTLSYFQVDNPLVRAIDPAFIGWHLRQGSEMTSKMVPKAYAEEKLGHFCTREGKLVVIEYSDLPMAMQRETEADGRLRYRSGSIAIHLLDREFIRRMAESGELAFHRADKKIPALDSAGQPLKPDQANGVKFELFVFDALPFAKNPLVIETERAEDFSPVKNADGVDSPQSSRDDQLRQAARWLRAAGAKVPTDAQGLPPFRLEISPLFATDATECAENWARLSPPPALADGLYLG